MRRSIPLLVIIIVCLVFPFGSASLSEGRSPYCRLYCLFLITIVLVRYSCYILHYAAKIRIIFLTTKKKEKKLSDSIHNRSNPELSTGVTKEKVEKSLLNTQQNPIV